MCSHNKRKQCPIYFPVGFTYWQFLSSVNSATRLLSTASHFWHHMWQVRNEISTVLFIILVYTANICSVLKNTPYFLLLIILIIYSIYYIPPPWISTTKVSSKNKTSNVTSVNTSCNFFLTWFAWRPPVPLSINNPFIVAVKSNAIIFAESNC